MNPPPMRLAAASKSFHGMEKVFASFPWYGRNVSTVWKMLGIIALLMLAGCSKPEPQVPSLAEGQAAAISGVLSTNQIRIGDPVALTVSVLHRTNSTVVFPDIAQGKEVLVRDSAIHSETFTNGLQRTENRITLTSLVITNHIIGEKASILVSTAAGMETNAYPFFSLEVISSLAPGETDPRPAKTELAHWPAPPSRWIWMALIALALLAAAFLAVRRFLTTPRTILHMAPSIPPYQIALDALEALRAKGWIEDGTIEPFYVKLSDIVRRYLEARFGLRAPERTTEEFIHDALSIKILTASQREVLAAFLEQSDLVKFAKHTPGPSDMHNALDSATQLIRETMPVQAAINSAKETAQTDPESDGGAS